MTEIVKDRRRFEDVDERFIGDAIDVLIIQRECLVRGLTGRLSRLLAQDSPLEEFGKGVNTSVNGRKGPSIFPILRIFCVRISEKGKSWVRIEVLFQEGKRKKEKKVGKLNVRKLNIIDAIVISGWA